MSGADRGGGVGAGAAIYVSSYCCMCVRILLYIGSVNEADRGGGGALGAGAAIYVSSHCYICVLILLFIHMLSRVLLYVCLRCL